MQPGTLTASYRLAIASRAVASIVGGYAIATFALAIFLPMSKAEASLTATMLSFLIYTCAVVWVFATRSAWRAWAGILVPSIALGALVLIQRSTAGV
jgi:hypothetical protein